MLPDRVSNQGPLTYESGALPIALRGPASVDDIENLTRVVISYEMTTSVRFCLSYDPIKVGFYRLQNAHYFNKKTQC